MNFNSDTLTMDPRPSTQYHSQEVLEFNRKSRTQDGIDLSEHGLIAEARRATGLDHFGDETFLPAMRALLGSLETEANLNPFGRFVARARCLNALKNRLWAADCFARHPEIRERKIAAPIVIIGPHRSGTTRMHGMMATDNRLRHLKAWEGINPAPRLDQADLGRSARHDEAKAALDARGSTYPGAFQAHPMKADWPEEEMLLLNHSFCGFTPLGLYYVPSYYRWFLNADKAAAYRYMADLMKIISWSAAAPEDRPWVLKNPQHMLDLGTLLSVFPDAKLVFTHRDPIKTVASTLSLMWLYSVQHTDAPCRAQVRDVWLDFCEEAARRCMQNRGSIPKMQQFDVRYEEMNRDWRATMRHVYDFIGLEFLAEVEQAMSTWVDKARSEKQHGDHRYSLDDFGVTPQEVDARMMFVRNKYAIPYEEK